MDGSTSPSTSQARTAPTTRKRTGQPDDRAGRAWQLSPSSRDFYDKKALLSDIKNAPQGRLFGPEAPGEAILNAFVKPTFNKTEGKYVQGRLPEADDSHPYLTVRLKDGTLVVDKNQEFAVHSQLLDAMGVDPQDVRDGGFFRHGEYTFSPFSEVKTGLPKGWKAGPQARSFGLRAWAKPSRRATWSSTRKRSGGSSRDKKAAYDDLLQEPRKASQWKGAGQVPPSFKKPEDIIKAVGGKARFNTRLSFDPESLSPKDVNLKVFEAIEKAKSSPEYGELFDAVYDQGGNAVAEGLRVQGQGDVQTVRHDGGKADQ
ncbi:MAG: hypothetical protein MZV70_54385 [Desulfobacterales bacterium]|nr:hypothetical protein [Desulfobacterales bacterium]